MPVRWNKIYFPFTNGLDKKVDEKVISPPVMDTLENCIFSKRGTIQKRTGYDPLGTVTVNDTTINARGRNLATREDELLMLNEDFLYTYDTVENKWSIGGGTSLTLHSPVVEEFVDAYNSFDQTNSSRGVLNNVAVTAWENKQTVDTGSQTNAEIEIQVTNTVTGAVYYCHTVVDHIKPHVVVSGNTLRLYACATSGYVGNERIGVWVFDTTDPGTIPTRTEVVMADLVTNIYAYDVAPSGQNNGEVYMVAYESPGNVVTRQLSATDGITTVNSDSFARTNVSMVTLGVESVTGGSNVGIVWVENPVTATDETYVHLYDSTVTTLNGTALVFSQPSGVGARASRSFQAGITLAWQSSTSTRIMFTNIDPNSGGGFLFPWAMEARRYDTAGAVVAGGPNMLGVTPASKAFYDNGRWYMWVAYESSLQSQYVCIRDDDFIAARVLPGIGGGFQGSGPSDDTGLANREDQIAPNGKYMFDVQTVNRATTAALQYKRRVDTNQVTTLTAAAAPDNETQVNAVFTEKGIRTVTLDFAGDQGYQSREAGDVAYINGGLLQQFDGVQVAESGFLLYPEGFSAFPSTPGAGALPPGQYAYKVYYEWTNAQGQRERSTTAGPVVGEVTVANSNMDVFVPYTSLTNRTTTDISIAIYRTEINPTFDSPYYRVTSFDPLTVGDNNGYIRNFNTPGDTAEGFLFTDIMIDSTLIRQELDEANSGELDNVAPPPPTIMATGKNRLFIASYEDDSLVRYSKVRQDQDAFEFNEALTIPIEDGGGQITGLSILNEVLVVFKAERIYIIAGDGPNNLGFGTFGNPQRISSDVGCIDQRSIVLTPLGLMFQSRKGIFLLSQQFQISYIGARVEGLLGTITGGTLDEENNRVIFLQQADDALVYDYFFDQWSTWTNHSGFGSIVSRNLYNYLRTDQLTVYRENLTSFTDAGQSFFLTARTGWLKLEGLQNYQRTRKLELSGNYKSPHKLNVFVQYNYYAIGTGAEDQYQYVPDTAAEQTPYQFEVQLRRQKAMAARFRFTDSVADGEIVSAQAVELTELALEVGLKDTLNKTGNRATAV